MSGAFGTATLIREESGYRTVDALVADFESRARLGGGNRWCGNGPRPHSHWPGDYGHDTPLTAS
jgi:hypothetical protein